MGGISWIPITRGVDQSGLTTRERRWVSRNKACCSCQRLSCYSFSFDASALLLMLHLAWLSSPPPCTHRGGRPFLGAGEKHGQITRFSDALCSLLLSSCDLSHLPLPEALFPQPSMGGRFFF